uniref:Reverse transcriptase domain-containing protein n=1 Tax=Triticum urartu TaxID=4572 RepID=A0A8R7QJY7_TRIUA
MKKQRALIMINGVPGDRINYVRGLRQGDPISLMLVVIAMEALTALISKAERSDVLSALPGLRINCTKSSAIVTRGDHRDHDEERIAPILQRSIGAFPCKYL